MIVDHAAFVSHHHIVGQQISTKAQATVWRRMQEALGTVDAGSVLAAGPEGLQALGISGRKAAYITDFALRVQSGAFDPETVRESSDAEAIRQLYAEHEAEVHFWKFCQYEFSLQWTALKAYAGENGIEIMGDIPIYVSPDSADVWAGRELFWLDEAGLPKEVAGCPPDYFSADGQLWGNPLYNWARHESTHYDWWIKRVRFSLELYDAVRIDHFRGFDTYYAIPYGAPNARKGEWRQGPGMRLWGEVLRALPGAAIVAEDLGEMFESVRALLKETGFPGMKVLQFAFDSREESDYLPHNYEKNCVVYTGTHDNDTILGWYYVMSEEDREFSKEYMGNAKSTDEELPWDFIRMSMESVANLAVTPMQEFLGLGTEARINYPSTLGNNWKWRLLPGQFTPEMAKRIHRLTQITARIAK